MNKQVSSEQHINDQKTAFMQKTWVVFIGAMISCTLWGSAFPCIKIGYGMMGIGASDIASQILYAGDRFTLAGVLTILLGSLMQRKVLLPKEKGSLGVIMLVSLFQTILQYLFFYIGLANTTGVKASIITGMNVFVAVLVASLIFKQEKLTARKLIGCAIGFSGVVLVNVAGKGMDFSLNLLGDGFVFLACFAYAFSSVIMKNFSKTYNPVLISGYQFVFGGLVMIAIGKLAGGRLAAFDGKSIAMLIYLALISAVGYSVWSILLKYNPVSKVAVFGFINPIVGVTLSALLLKESGSIGVSCLLALVLVCIGIYTVNKKN